MSQQKSEQGKRCLDDKEGIETGVTYEMSWLAASGFPTVG